jgi:hypothetical protein
MCGANKRFFLYLLLGLLLASAAGALRAGERETWYLITETELRSIEKYKTNSEAEKRVWLLQVQELKTQAAGLRQESETLNDQLAFQREQAGILQRSFSGYEAESLMTISSKNGEIAGLNQMLSEQALETEKYKGTSRSRLIIIIAFAGTWIVFIAFKICRFFRVF